MASRESSITEKIKISADAGFAEWLEQPQTKFMMSIVPPGDHPDLLASLLRSAFDRGAQIGMTSIMIDMMLSMVRKKDGS